jgi:tRNA(Ile)-lysidine synthase
VRLGGDRLAPDPRDRLVSAANHILDRRLRRDSDRPIAVAFSGGGDSLALLLIADVWAHAAGRRLLVLTVDHRLQPASRAWTAACAATAGRLGAEFQALAWEGAKPAHGVPAAARAARHALLADAARRAGARVVLMGHTADDLLEARAMRAEGSTTPDPREWSPSPAWPQGRGVFLLRPLLGARRADVRAWLDAHAERWIDDPANEDRRFARVRARGGLDAATPTVETSPDTPQEIVRQCRGDADGGLRIARELVRRAPESAAVTLLSLACVCAGGGDRRPATARLRRLVEALRTDAAVTATLAGSRIEADDREVHILREAGEAARGGLRPLMLQPNEPAVWDGRFELETPRTGLEVRRLSGLARQLPEGQQRALQGFHAKVRPGLPVVVTPSGALSCPLLADGQMAIRSLVHDRLVAAAGLVPREPA